MLVKCIQVKYKVCRFIMHFCVKAIGRREDFVSTKVTKIMSGLIFIN